VFSGSQSPPTLMASSLDRGRLLARIDRIRQIARHGRRSPHKPLLLLYALAQLKHGLRTEIRFNAEETVVRPLLLTYAPPGTKARVGDPFGRLENDGLWHLPHREEPTDAAGNIREALARERDAPAGFMPEVLATFAREPELIDVASIRLWSGISRSTHIKRSSMPSGFGSVPNCLAL
jgi:putative restriction endonuclease